MKRHFIPISTLFVLTSCHLGYGPLQDRSKFVSARLADDQRTVLFSFHHFAYRAATGWRAFPDGGIPDYVTDISVLGTYDLQTRKLTVLRREKNSQWQPGSGLLTIHSMNGTKALISQGGQLRGPFAHGVKYVLLDFMLRDSSDLDLKSDLAALRPGHWPDLSCRRRRHAVVCDLVAGGSERPKGVSKQQTGPRDLGSHAGGRVCEGWRVSAL